MARNVSRVPPDLRARRDLTLATIERVQALRTERKRLQTKLADLPAMKKRLEDDIKATEDQEAEILKTK